MPALQGRAMKFERFLRVFWIQWRFTLLSCIISCNGVATNSACLGIPIVVLTLVAINRLVTTTSFRKPRWFRM